MDDWEYCIEIIMVLYERTNDTKVYGNKHATVERITQTIDDCKFSCQNKNSTLERMDECHSFWAKTDALHQRMNGFN